MKKKENKKLLILLLLLVIIGIFLWNHLNKVTVTLNVNGTTHEVGNVDKGDVIEEPEKPEKEGYTFDGWYVGEEKFDFTKPVTEDVELEAKWVLNEYTITIKVGNGNVINETIKHGENITEPEAPTKEGHIFLGWYVGEEEFDFTKPVTGNVELEAKWVLNTYSAYTVEHYLMDRNGEYSNEPFEKELLVGKTDKYIKVKTKEYKGYTSPEVETVKLSVDGDTIVRYYYSINKYTVTVMGDEGVSEVTGDGSYYYGDEVEINYSLNPGYSVLSFSEEVNDNIYIMGDGDVVITITTKANPDVEYKVEHYLMGLDGKYTVPTETEVFMGAINLVVTPNTKEYVGFTSPDVRNVTINEDGTTVLRYYYQRNKYTLTLEFDEGIQSVVGANEYYYEQEISLEAVINTGYSFKAWTKDGIDYANSMNSTIKMEGNNLVLKAETTPNKYTINFESNGGSEVESIVQDYKSTVTEPTNPTKDGYEFIGWYSDEELTNAYEFTTIPAYDVTLYAKWEANEYTVTFNPNGGTGSMSNQTLVYDQASKLNSNKFSKLGYIFKGWSDEENGNVVYQNEEEVKNLATSGNKVLYAVWEVETYTITYELEGGVLDKTNPLTYTVETSDIVLNNPTKLGYTFTNWELNGKEITEIKKGTTGNLVIKAIYKANTDTKYTVEHYLMGLDGKYTTAKDIDNLKGTTDTTVKPAVKEYVGFTSPNVIELTIKADGTAVLKYYYERNKYTLTLKFDEGIESVNTNGSYYYEQEIKISAVVKDGYTFTKWTKDNKDYSNTLETTIKMEANNMTFKANSIVNEYTIKFESNGGSKVNDIKAKYGVSITEPANPTRNGFVFIGWYKEESLTNKFEFTTMPSKNMTLYAKWEIADNTIVFNTNGGTEIDPITQDVGSVVTKPNDPTKTGYTFKGWYSDSKLTTSYEFTTMQEEGIMIYAKWEANEYTVTFDSNGGTGEVQAQTFTYDQALKLNNNKFTRTGYNFKGWSETKTGEVVYQNEEEVKNLATSGNKTLYAVWEVITYTITYDLVGGVLENENPTTYTVETSDIILNNPNKAGYTFVSWHINGNMIDKITKGTTGDIVISSLYKANTDTKYTVEHYLMGLDGKYTTAKDIDSLTGTTDTTVNPSTKEYVGFTSPSVSEITIKGDGTAVLKYYYERNKYTLTVDKGTGIESVTGSGSYYYEQEVEITATPKLGYEFENWSTGSTTSTSTHKISANNETITANGKAITYTITYDLVGGKLTTNNPTTYTVETIDIILNNPTKDGYTFVNWELDGNSITKIAKGTTGNLTVTAVYTPIKYTITYDLDGGKLSSPNPTEYTIETNVVLNNPTKLGYKFAGWSLNGNIITEVKEGTMGNLTIKATYVPSTDVTYTVEHYLMGLDGKYTTAKDVEVLEGTTNSTVKPAVKEYTGFTSPSVSELTIKADGTAVLKYYYQRNKYTLTVNKGVEIESVTGSGSYYYEQEVEITAKAKVGYEFEKWSTGQTTLKTTHKISANNETITANGKANNYQVKYNGNGSTSGSMSNSTHTYDLESNLTQNGFVKDYVITYDYNHDSKKENVNVANVFDGWATTASGNVVYKDKQSVLNLTDKKDEVVNLYAKWSNPTTTLMTPERDGYLFTGWSTTKDGKNIISNDNYKLTGNVTLYATWKLIPRFESLSFDLYKDENAKEAYSTKDVFSKGDNAFYIKLPEDGYLDINSISFILNTAITFNTSAKSSSNYLDITAAASNKIELAGNTVTVKTTDGGKTWVRGSSTKSLYGVKFFLQVLSSQYGGKNIGIAENFGLSVENGLGTPHYVSTRTSINGSTYLFFSREGTKNITVTYMNGNNKMLTVSVPYGSTAPNIGEYKLSGYNFINWCSDSNLTTNFDFTKPLYENTIVYGNYELGDIDISWYDESSTSYNISTLKQLKGFAALASNGTSFQNKTVNLTKDINLNNEEWTPISSFNGTFNGGNHTISNLNITEASGVAGFFNTLTSTAKVTNLKFEGVNISNTATSQAGTVAAKSNGSTIEKVSVNNVNIKSQTVAGGILGSAGNGTIINECSVTNGTVYVTDTDAGGIVASASNTVTFTNLYASVTVKSDSVAAPDAGGILGVYTNSPNLLTMKNVIFTGKISASPWLYKSFGPIHGRIGVSSTGNNSYNNDRYGNKTNWFYNKDSIGISSNLDRGTGKTTSELKTVSTYSTFDTNIWNINAGSYPTLKWMN